MINTIHMGLVTEVAVKTLLASGLTLAALRMMASRTAAERSFVAHLGLAATLAIPFAALVLPDWRISDRLAWLCTIIAPSWVYAVPAALLAASRRSPWRACSACAIARPCWSSPPGSARWRMPKGAWGSNRAPLCWSARTSPLR